MSRSVFLYDKVQTPPVLRAEVSHPCVADTHALCGAVPCEKNITFSLRVSVSAALCAVTLLLYRDDDAKTLRYSLRLCDREADTETWRITLPVPPLCGDGESGLFFYRYCVCTPYGETLCGPAYGTPDPIFGDESRCEAFYLTVYRPGYTVPDWMPGATLYQIFPDRFARGGADALHPLGIAPPLPKEHAGARLHEDWGEPIEQYGEIPGDFVRNNEFYGGTLRGIEEKLPYLESLGINCIYLCPVFFSVTNHRYDTADYEMIDPLLGTNEDFRSLAAAAKKHGIHILLDGVFDHTGADSRYFNKRERFGKGVGAYWDRQSPYTPWYRFKNWPNDYECWWGVDEMPQLDTSNASLRRYFCARDGIVARWIRAGADGWRLDVADELSDGFLEELRAAAREANPKALILGEVWEDASDKIAYGHRRRYFRGSQLDSVMNYPLRDCILRFVLQGDGAALRNTVLRLFTHYPRLVNAMTMNLIGSHDTMRALTVLGEAKTEGLGGTALRALRLTEKQKELALRRIRLAAALQFTLPGVPCIYYGDEAGMQGARDPFCRAPFPWGQEDTALTEYYRTLGALRKSTPALRCSEAEFLLFEQDHVIYRRSELGRGILVLANAAECPFSLPSPLSSAAVDLLTAQPVGKEIPPMSAVILVV